MKRSTILLLSLLAGSSAVAEDGGLGSILAPVTLASNATTASASYAAAGATKPAISVVTESAVLAKLEKELTRQLSLTGELELSFARPWQPLRVPAEDWRVVVPELPIGGLTRSFIIEVRIMANDRAWYAQQVVVQAQLMQPGLVANRRLDRGQTLDRASVDVKTIDILRERQKPIPGDTELEGNEVLQSIPEGATLTWRDVGSSPLVRKGAVVDVIAEGNGISVSMKGMAMQTGAQDDVVTVRNTDTRKDFQGRVVKRNTVRVTF